MVALLKVCVVSHLAANKFDIGFRHIIPLNQLQFFSVVIINS